MKESNKVKKFWEDERGEFGIKQIAFTVAIIVIIGFVITGMKDSMPEFITQVWGILIGRIEKITG